MMEKMIENWIQQHPLVGVALILILLGMMVFLARSFYYDVWLNNK